MDVLSMIKHSLVADGSNPISKHFQLGRQVGTAGPEMIWKIYDAVRMRDNKEVSIFFFEKRVADKLHKPKRREIVTELMRREIKQLSRFKHSAILRILHPIEECHDSLAFATESVLGSLANLLGNYDRMPAPLPIDIKDFSFLEAEIKYGILHVAEALTYLHNMEHVVHGNINPASIIITRRGMWKLAGLAFTERPPRESKQKSGDGFRLGPWTSKHPKMVQPDLDFMAPEVQLEASSSSITSSCDMFSLGLTVCAIYNGGKSLIQANHSIGAYSKHIERMTELFSEVAHKMPLQLVEPVEKMINKDIRYRPTAQSFTMLKFFDEAMVRCMQSLDEVESKDLTQKCEFFTRLAQTIPQFPRKILYKSVFPMLQEQLNQADMLVLVLPSIVAMVENASDDDYQSTLQPEVKRLFNMTRPVQATVYLLEKLAVLLSKASEEEVKSDVLPMIFSTLESNSIQGQEAAISVFSTIKKYLDDQTMRKLVLPKAKALFNKSTSIRTKLNALACIDRLLDSLDKMMILDEVLPFLTEIQGQDVDIIMAIIAIYKHMLSDKKFGLTHNLLATKVLPTLIPHTVIPGLNLEQFQTLIGVLREMLDQIDRQRRAKMMNEAPDDQALELRSSMQQMYYLASRAQSLKLPEEYQVLRQLAAKRPSWGGSSNSSIGSNYSVGGRGSPRRTSIDMRYNALDGAGSACKTDNNVAGGSKYLLSVDEAYYSRCRPPSTPELQTRRGSSESLGPKAYRRHSSFQGLGMEEQAVLEKIVKERRASLAPGSSHGTGAAPHILVSEPSTSELDESLFYGGPPRRASTQSMGPVVVPEPGRRDSRGRLLDLPSAQRRSSFQGICESAMQFFVGK